MRAMMVAMGLAVLAGTPAAAQRGVETISYAVGPCYGTCPVYRVTVSSDGRGIFVGERHTAVTGERRFRVTPQQWQAFRHRLAALHGRGRIDLTGPPLCEALATDLPTVTVRWQGRFRPFLLTANYGCSAPRQAWMFSHLRKAPGDLPIAGFIGRR